jgi:hypothetical protein
MATRYDPSSLVIFSSGALYYSISEWKSGIQSVGDKLTPGWVGNIFFLLLSMLFTEKLESWCFRLSLTFIIKGLWHFTKDLSKKRLIVHMI